MVTSSQPAMGVYEIVSEPESVVNVPHSTNGDPSEMPLSEAVEAELKTRNQNLPKEKESSQQEGDSSMESKEASQGVPGRSKEAEIKTKSDPYSKLLESLTSKSNQDGSNHTKPLQSKGLMARVVKRGRGRPRKTVPKSDEVNESAAQLIASRTDDDLGENSAKMIQSVNKETEVKKRKPGRRKKTTTKSEEEKEPATDLEPSNKDGGLDLVEKKKEDNTKVKRRGPGRPRKSAGKSLLPRATDNATMQSVQLEPSVKDALKDNSGALEGGHVELPKNDRLPTEVQNQRRPGRPKKSETESAPSHSSDEVTKQPSDSHSDGNVSETLKSEEQKAVEQKAVVKRKPGRPKKIEQHVRLEASKEGGELGNNHGEQLKSTECRTEVEEQELGSLKEAETKLVGSASAKSGDSHEEHAVQLNQSARLDGDGDHSGETQSEVNSQSTNTSDGSGTQLRPPCLETQLHSDTLPGQAVADKERQPGEERQAPGESREELTESQPAPSSGDTENRPIELEPSSRYDGGVSEPVNTEVLEQNPDLPKEADTSLQSVPSNDNTGADPAQQKPSDKDGQVDDSSEQSKKKDTQGVVEKRRPGRPKKTEGKSSKSEMSILHSDSTVEQARLLHTASPLAQLQDSLTEQASSRELVTGRKRRPGRPRKINRSVFRSSSSPADDKQLSSNVDPEKTRPPFRDCTDKQPPPDDSTDKKPSRDVVDKQPSTTDKGDGRNSGQSPGQPADNKERRKPGRPRKRKPEEPLEGVVTKKTRTLSSEESQEQPHLSSAEDGETALKPNKKPKRKKKGRLVLSHRKKYSKHFPTDTNSAEESTSPMIEQVETLASSLHVTEPGEERMGLIPDADGVELASVESERSRSPEIPLQNTHTSLIAQSRDSTETEPLNGQTPEDGALGQSQSAKELRPRENGHEPVGLIEHTPVDSEVNAHTCDDASSKNGLTHETVSVDSLVPELDTGAATDTHERTTACTRVEATPTDQETDEPKGQEPTADGVGSVNSVEADSSVDQTNSLTNLVTTKGFRPAVPSSKVENSGKSKKSKTRDSKLNSQRTKALKALPKKFPIGFVANGVLGDKSILPPCKKRKTLLTSNSTNVSALQLSVVDTQVSIG